MNRHEFFVKRLKEMGLYDEDSDYRGMIGRCIEKLSEVFSCQGHSGGSAYVTRAVCNQLMDEWEQVGPPNPPVDTSDPALDDFALNDPAFGREKA